ncbi:MAG: lamin tail domain-containing protein [Anaerolineales bacterium]|nr:lamin tail domain-containing protein [Anaerolineales bacterium]
MDRRKLIQYLLLNVFVSASVTGGILFWYDRNYRAISQPAVIQQAAPVSNGNSAPESNIDLQTDIPVKISSVVGSGVLTSEVVIIKFEGEGELDLTSWQLKDDNGNTFTFPKVTLYPNGAVQVHTNTGTDTVIDLYWGTGDAVWDSGENARLFDSQGNLRAVYRVP